MRPQAAKLSEFDRVHVGEILEAGGEYTNYSAHVLRLIARADGEQREVIRTVYPDHVAAFEVWERGEPLME